MKKKLLLLFFTLLTVHSYSQVVFEKGYFINNNDQKTECLIKNLDWNSTPTEFQYKLDEQDQPITTNLQQVKEFAISNESKYERYTLNADLSSDNFNEVDYSKVPKFKEEKIFLKVLVQGKANLYEYSKNNLTFYFFKTDTIPVNQLIYKTYKVSEDQVAKNKQYKQQIWMALKCDNITLKDIENLNYKRNELINLFVKYNECNNSEFTNFDKKEKGKNSFHLSIRPGIKNSNLYVSNSYTSDRDRDFGNKLGFRIGLEVEYVLPFNKNKWALIIEPTYQSYKTERVDYGDKKSEVNYQSIELPIGIRHYIFLNNNSKIFINAQYTIEAAFNSEAKILFNSYIVDEPKVDPQVGFAVGAGYNFKKKYSAELRYSNKSIIGNHEYLSSRYGTVSLIFGYTIF
ncbi:outer membrane beta-barrel protein [Flavobacterium sp.]|uniref:outer membrane beta-barrel protein n=1 Tax=Flavobacterium sp. TaxID=239 RepID=UPI003D13CEB6